MATYGLLIDYEYCTNCGSCQVSCQEEHDYPVGKTGIKVLVDGPWQLDEKRWNFNYWPAVTDLCDLCAERTGKGREPMCVHHCLANVITYGEVENLAEKLAAKPKQFLVVPQYLPLDAKAPFASKGTEKRTAAHIDVQVSGEATFGVHRTDAKVGSFSSDSSTF